MEEREVVVWRTVGSEAGGMASVEAEVEEGLGRRGECDTERHPPTVSSKELRYRAPPDGNGVTAIGYDILVAWILFYAN